MFIFDQRRIMHMYYRIFRFISEYDDEKSQFWHLSPFEGIISLGGKSFSQYQHNPHGGVKLVYHFSYNILHARDNSCAFSISHIGREVWSSSYAIPVLHFYCVAIII